MLGFIGDTKTQYDLIQKSRLRQIQAALAVVITGIEQQLVNASLELIASQDRLIAAAIIVGFHFGNQRPLITVNPKQPDRDIIAGAAMGRVQHMCR